MPFVCLSSLRGWMPVLIILLLCGCAGKRDSEPQITLTETSERSHGGGSLSSPEQKALEASGSIDKNIPSHAMEDVRKEYQNYLRDRRQSVCVFSKRSEQYLAYARRVFRERGMPEELANLAIVESGYRPDALSKAGAAGAWQFMPKTGLNYGLTQDWWQDDRLDPYRATEAAADYLQKLYNDFGDWPTAIAAYNAGEGKISRALSGTGGKDFYELKTLNHTLTEDAQIREETKNYVPRFLAVTKIMRNLPELGFEAINPDKTPVINRYSASPGTDLKALSKACDLSWEEFSKHNPHHKRSITCTDRVTYVYLPSRVDKKAAQYLCSNESARYTGWHPAKVASGADSLEKISKRGNVSLALLQAANPGISKLKAGQVILVPDRVNMSLKAAGNEKIASSNSVMKAANQLVQSHTVKAKETLYAIAKKYNVDVESLRKCNGLQNGAPLRAGAALSIPSKNPLKAGSSGKIGNKKQVYVVQAKDNLWKIAKRHNITVETLKRLNNIDEKALRPGASLVVAEE